jgi:hypothetical protein
MEMLRREIFLLLLIPFAAAASLLIVASLSGESPTYGTVYRELTPAS